MVETMGWIPVIFISLAMGYLLGALPLADLVSRRQGVNIFSVGTGLAGAANVRRSVGPLSGGIVLLGDTGKGALAVLAPRIMGLDDTWILLPTAAAVLGHWKSIFSGFRGGDGLATLGGAGVVLFPVIGLVSACIAILVSLSAQRMPYSSLISVVFWYAALVSLSMAFDANLKLALGLGGLGGLVLAYALAGHRRRRTVTGWEDIEPEESNPMGSSYSESPTGTE